MFPILVVNHGRLAMREEAYLRERFDERYEAWAAHIPGFVRALHVLMPAAQKP
jgi:protein-S-isoprenylcysteine O-methyltransferase Ste14